MSDLKNRKRRYIDDTQPLEFHEIKNSFEKKRKKLPGIRWAKWILYLLIILGIAWYVRYVK